MTSPPLLCARCRLVRLLGLERVTNPEAPIALVVCCGDSLCGVHLTEHVVSAHQPKQIPLEEALPSRPPDPPPPPPPVSVKTILGYGDRR